MVTCSVTKTTIACLPIIELFFITVVLTEKERLCQSSKYKWWNVLESIVSHLKNSWYTFLKKLVFPKIVVTVTKHIFLFSLSSMHVISCASFINQIWLSNMSNEHCVWIGFFPVGWTKRWSISQIRKLDVAVPQVSETVKCFGQTAHVLRLTALGATRRKSQYKAGLTLSPRLNVKKLITAIRAIDKMKTLRGFLFWLRKEEDKLH